MPKYLFEAKYTPEGVRGLKEAGASSRAKAVGDMRNSRHRFGLNSIPDGKKGILT